MSHSPGLNCHLYSQLSTDTYWQTCIGRGIKSGVVHDTSLVRVCADVWGPPGMQQCALPCHNFVKLQLQSLVPPCASSTAIAPMLILRCCADSNRNHAVFCQVSPGTQWCRQYFHVMQQQLTLLSGQQLAAAAASLGQLGWTDWPDGWANMLSARLAPELSSMTARQLMQAAQVCHCCCCCWYRCCWHMTELFCKLSCLFCVEADPASQIQWGPHQFLNTSHATASSLWCHGCLKSSIRFSFQE